MIRPILTHPDPVSRERSAPLRPADGEARALLDDMLEAMDAANRRGVAAVQGGFRSRSGGPHRLTHLIEDCPALNETGGAALLRGNCRPAPAWA